MSATTSSSSRYSNAPDPPASIELLKRIKVKLHAFLDDPSTTLAAYPDSDQSVVARYARAIAYYRMPKLDKALPTIDGLIRDFPNDPYFRELKGQMLFENGRMREAMQPYEEAVRLAPLGRAAAHLAGAGLYRERRPGAEQARDRLSQRRQPRRGPRKPGLAFPRGRLWPRQPDRHGGAVAGRGGARRRQEKGRDAAGQPRQAAAAEELAAYVRAEDIHREAEQLDN